MASTCYFRFDHNFTASHNTQSTSQNSNATAFIASPETVNCPSWYVDSGATNHITADLNNLHVKDDYKGKGKIVVGNGHSLLISHIGSSQISSCAKPLLLNNILYAPAITKNLLSVSQITRDNHVFAEFHADYCLLKDKTTRKVLLRGRLKDGLYQLDVSKLHDDFKFADSSFQQSMSKVTNKNALSSKGNSQSYFSGLQSVNSVELVDSKDNAMGTCNVVNLWHARLGHPCQRVLNNVLINLNINKTPISDFCSVCQLAKSHKQPFSSSPSHTSGILEILHVDVWGPSPVVSSERYRYYLSIVDDFTCFSWIFPMKVKAEVKDIFLKFVAFAERQYSCKVRTVQSDWGGEFRSLSSVFSQLGIGFRHPCPYTHEQNGKVERKHRHIVEIGLTLLAQASLPLKFWWHAFASAVFLINCLPTPILHNISPFEAVHNRRPDYMQFKVFGCSCFPHLRPYNKHKLMYRSSKCVFLGTAYHTKDISVFIHLEDCI